MEKMIDVLTYIFAIGMFSFPFICLIALRYREGNMNGLKNIAIVVFGTVLIVVFYAWWVHYSNELLLSFYGYRLEGSWSSENERYFNVKKENLAMVKQLNLSRMGIGWTLKAILALLFMIPYSLFVYILGIYLLKRFSLFKVLRTHMTKTGGDDWRD